VPAGAVRRRADVRPLRRHLGEEHRRLAGQFDQRGWVTLASTFHLRLAALAGNPVLERYLKELASRCSLIVAPIEKRDGAAVMALMHDHLSDLEQRVAIGSGRPGDGLAEMRGFDVRELGPRGPEDFPGRMERPRQRRRAR